MWALMCGCRPSSATKSPIYRICAIPCEDNGTKRFQDPQPLSVCVYLSLGFSHSHEVHKQGYRTLIASYQKQDEYVETQISLRIMHISRSNMRAATHLFWASELFRSFARSAGSEQLSRATRAKRASQQVAGQVLQCGGAAMVQARRRPHARSLLTNASVLRGSSIFQKGTVASQRVALGRMR